MPKNLAALNGSDQNLFRSALASMGYMVPVAASTGISSPVAFVDLALPAGYVEFEVHGVGVRTDAAMCFLLSMDNGATWISDAGGDEEAYQYKQPDGTGNTQATGACALTVDTATGRSFNITMSIVPGAADEYASVYSIGTMVNVQGQPLIDRGILTCLHLDLGRVNKIRILASDQWVYDNDDVSRLSAGSFSVFGLPTPV